MKTFKQALKLFTVGLAGGILLYGLWDSVIILGLTLAVVYVLYKVWGQTLTRKVGVGHD